MNLSRGKPPPSGRPRRYAAAAIFPTRRFACGGKGEAAFIRPKNQKSRETREHEPWREWLVATAGALHYVGAMGTRGKRFSSDLRSGSYCAADGRAGARRPVALRRQREEDSFALADARALGGRFASRPAMEEGQYEIACPEPPTNPLSPWSGRYPTTCTWRFAFAGHDNSTEWSACICGLAAVQIRRNPERSWTCKFAGSAPPWVQKSQRSISIA